MLHVYIQLHKFQAQKSHLFIYRIEILVKIRKNCSNKITQKSRLIVSYSENHTKKDKYNREKVVKRLKVNSGREFENFV